MDKGIFNIVQIVLLLTMVVFLGLDDHYKTEKEQEYQNDERWKMIKLKANQKILDCYHYIAMTVAIILIINTVTGEFDWNLNWDLIQVLNGLFWVFFLRYPLEYVMLRHYNKVL